MCGYIDARRAACRLHAVKRQVSVGVCGRTWWTCAGAGVHDLDGMRAVGALDLDVLRALRCSQQRRVVLGTHNRERKPAWVRKDLTGINGRAKIKDSKPPTRAEILQKQHFAFEMAHAALAMFSRCAAPLPTHRCIKSTERHSCLSIAGLWQSWTRHLRAFVCHTHSAIVVCCSLSVAKRVSRRAVLLVCAREV